MKSRRTHVLTRTALYDLVWTEPVKIVAKRYKISDSGLAKICKRHGIPLPLRGHWAKLKHGKKTQRPALKPAPAGEEESVRIQEGSGPRPPAPPRPELEPPIASAVEWALQSENRIVVPEDASRSHRLVLEIARSMDRSWDGKRKTPEPLEQRRRRILDAFFRGVERARGTVTVRPYEGGFDVELFGSAFHLRCSEPERRVRVPLTPKELRNRQSWETRDWKNETRKTGILRIRVYGESERHKDFVDAQDASLDDRLTQVLVSLLRNTITIEERDRRAEAVRLFEVEAERKRFEEEKLEWRRQERRRRERERVVALVDEAARWRRCRGHPRLRRGCARYSQGSMDRLGARRG